VGERALKSRLRASPLPLLVLLAAAAPGRLAADIAIVTSPATAIDAVDEADVKALWLGARDRIGDVRLAVADRSDEEIRDSFYHLVLHKTRGQIKAIWAKRGFQYGLPPPPAFPNDESVLDWVRGATGRLGYVWDVSADDSVKVLFTVELPAEKEGGP